MTHVLCFILLFSGEVCMNLVLFILQISGRNYEHAWRLLCGNNYNYKFNLFNLMESYLGFRNFLPVSILVSCIFLENFSVYLNTEIFWNKVVHDIFSLLFVIVCRICGNSSFALLILAICVFSLFLNHTW